MAISVAISASAWLVMGSLEPALDLPRIIWLLFSAMFGLAWGDIMGDTILRHESGEDAGKLQTTC